MELSDVSCGLNLMSLRKNIKFNGPTQFLTSKTLLFAGYQWLTAWRQSAQTPSLTVK